MIQPGMHSLLVASRYKIPVATAVMTIALLSHIKQAAYHCTIPTNELQIQV